MANAGTNRSRSTVSVDAARIESGASEDCADEVQQLRARTRTEFRIPDGIGNHEASKRKEWTGHVAQLVVAGRDEITPPKSARTSCRTRLPADRRAGARRT